jgi:hypothetical protein
MGAYKTLAIELQELGGDVDLTEAEEVFDFVAITRWNKKPLSRLMLVAISYELVKPTHRWLLSNTEFVDCWDWHGANCG